LQVYICRSWPVSVISTHSFHLLQQPCTIRWTSNSLHSSYCEYSSDHYCLKFFLVSMFFWIDCKEFLMHCVAHRSDITMDLISSVVTQEYSSTGCLFLSATSTNAVCRCVRGPVSWNALFSITLLTLLRRQELHCRLETLFHPSFGRHSIRLSLRAVHCKNAHCNILS